MPTAGLQVFNDGGKTRLWGGHSITRIVGSTTIGGGSGAMQLPLLNGVTGRQWAYAQMLVFGIQGGYSVDIENGLLSWHWNRDGDSSISATGPATLVYYGVY